MFNTYIIFTFTLLSYLNSCYSKSPSYQEVYSKAQGYNDYLLETRRWIHQHAELGFEEFETSKYVQDALTKHNITFTSNWGTNTFDPRPYGTGIVAQVGTGHGPCVALRGDMDALPIKEAVDVPFKSQNEGVMHACGHDVHTTMLLGAAIMLKEYEKDFNGTVKFFFQPAEEGGGGGKMMADEGAMDQYPPVERVFGQHVMSSYPSGTIWANDNTMHASVDRFHITIKGKGGHAASHHHTIDPVTATMAIVRSLYDIYSRELYFQPEHAGLISVTYVDAGSKATNVIPDTAEMGGTMRALRTNTLAYIKKRVQEVSEEIGNAYRCEVQVKFSNVSYPSVENDPEVFKFFKKFAGEAAVDGYVHVPEPMMGSEDYSFFSAKAPSVFYHLGSGSSESPKSNEPHHNAKFAVDESVIPQGTSLFTYIAMKSIEDLEIQNQQKGQETNEAFDKNEL